MTNDTSKKTLTYSHLTLEERESIALGLASGLSKSAIAKSLQRSLSTITRECSRNQPQTNKVQYRAHPAHMRSLNRKQQSHLRERLKSKQTRDYTEEKLRIGWTPELISGRIRVEGKLATTNHESIYQWIYTQRKDLIQFLPRSHRKRRKRGSAKYKHASKIPNRVPIEMRPDEVNLRLLPGHWEADTAVSSQSAAAIAVVIERVTRLVKITLLPSKSALNMHTALSERLKEVPLKYRKSITYDNGSENTMHAATNAALGTVSFFCNPYHSWEKGPVENVIGLIRRFYPKKTDWALLSQSDLANIESLLNSRPKKCLNFKSPFEAYVALAA